MIRILIPAFVLTVVFWYAIWMLSVYVGARCARCFAALWGVLVVVTAAAVALWPDESYITGRLLLVCLLGLVTVANLVLYRKGGRLVRRGWFGER